MSLLLRSIPAPIPTSTKNRTGVATIVKQAPAGQHTIEWWVAWLAAHWDV